MTKHVQLLATTGGLMLGGSTTFLLNLANAFRDRGELLPVVSFSESNEMERDFAASEVIIHRGSRQSIYEDRILQAYRATAKWRPRAVLACLSSESFEVLRLVPPGVIRLGIVQSHDPLPYQTIRAFRPWLDAVVGVSSTIRDHLLNDVQFPRAVHIPYGIRFAPIAQQPVREPGQPLRLIYVGRLIEVQKRVSRLVDLIRRLAANKEQFRFTFAGSGPELEASRTALRDLPQVEFLGEVTNQQVSELLKAHDIFVLLSDFEGLPLSLLESMGAGVVPVASDLESGIRNLVTEDTGVRVPVGDVAAAVKAITALAHDPVRLATLSRNAGQLAREEYGAARMAQRYLDLIAEFPVAAPAWPETVPVPRPFVTHHGWLYQGWPRRMRRWLKPVMNRLQI